MIVTSGIVTGSGIRTGGALRLEPGAHLAQVLMGRVAHLPLPVDPLHPLASAGGHHHESGMPYSGGQMVQGPMQGRLLHAWLPLQSPSQ